MRQNLSDTELLELLKEFDTPSITNVVATYPHDKNLCLGLYYWEHLFLDTFQEVKA
jgi:hypothetical protein